MKKSFLLWSILLFILSCNSDKENKQPLTKMAIKYPNPELNLKSAEYLYHFAFDCIDREYPHKPGIVLGDKSYLKEPSKLHPAFYGCFDWHSSVHGHWTLLNIVKELPDFEKKDSILLKLKKNITKENIEKELEVLHDSHNSDFERTYGWAWLLKVDETLLDWRTPLAMELHENLKPLVDEIVLKYKEFLPKLNYPIRVGEHTNTAFGLSFALDYALKYDKELAQIIIQRSKDYYLTDKDCPINWEPSGFDFLSPCLQEAALMLKVLPQDEYLVWLDGFLPGFRANPDKFLEVAIVTDRSDGKLAHLDGLNFSRAWCLYEIGNALSNEKFIQLANKHFDYSYSKMDSGEYAGAHWLASFALYATLKSN